MKRIIKVNWYPIDNIYELQTSRIGFLVSSPTYSLIERKYLVLEKVTDDIVPKIGLPKSIQVLKIGTDSVRLNILSSEIFDERLDTTISLKR
ncbi:MAG: hypothetical protein ACXWV4_11605 [Flavitalea sp.]